MMDVAQHPILETSNLVVGIPERQIVRGVDLSLSPGEILLVVGHNGAGKTSLLEGIMGLLPTQGGRVSLAGRDLAGVDTATRVRSGLALTRQTESVFRNLTVGENLRLAAAGRRSTDKSVVFDLFPVLHDRRSQMAGTLSGGQRQMLSIGLALQCSPKVLLLDEPSVGLQPTLVEEVLAKIDQIRHELSVSVLLVEQNISSALQTSDRVVVMNQGAVTYRAEAGEVDEELIWEQL